MIIFSELAEAVIQNKNLKSFLETRMTCGLSCSELYTLDIARLKNRNNALLEPGDANLNMVNFRVAAMVCRIN